MIKSRSDNSRQSESGDFCYDYWDAVSEVVRTTDSAWGLSGVLSRGFLGQTEPSQNRLDAQDLKKESESSWSPRREINGSSTGVNRTQGPLKAHERKRWTQRPHSQLIMVQLQVRSLQIPHFAFFLLLPQNLQDKKQQVTMEGSNRWWEQLMCWFRWKKGGETKHVSFPDTDFPTEAAICRQRRLMANQACSLH